MKSTECGMRSLWAVCVCMSERDSILGSVFCPEFVEFKKLCKQELVVISSETGK